jgi:hypothetical protein
VSNLLFNGLLIWLLIGVAEIFHGILRARLLNRRVGDPSFLRS